MKKICVSTYCDWDNYGSVFQSVGLKRALQELGMQSFIVKDRPADCAKFTRKLKISKNPKAVFIGVYNFFVRNKVALKQKKSLDFINKNVDIKYYDTYDVLKNNPPKADAYIAGSDQIWKMRVYRPAFFLDFAQGKKISYAASMGDINIPQKNREVFKRAINNFDCISVREADNRDVISQYTDKEISVHVDPAFLCSKEEWKKLEKPYDIKKPYILVYPIYWDKKYNEQLKKLHKKTGYDIVYIGSGFDNVYANKRIFDADPGQFLYLVDNAEGVVSSSFHGVSLSIILNKRISAIINPASPSRISHLLQLLGVENTEICNLANADTSFYEKTNERIVEEKEKSMKYLKAALSNE